MGFLRRVSAAIGDGPLFGRLRRERYQRAFAESTDGWPRFCGLYQTRAEAVAGAPRTRPVGYDHPGVATVKVDLMASVWTSDYPVLYWLHRLLGGTSRIFDLGGHVGTKYRAWGPYLDLADGVTWTVCDLPALVEAGRAAAGGSLHLAFTTSYERMDGTDVLLASGVLQYLDRDLASMLEACGEPPAHLLLNKVPTHDARDVYTLENLGESTVPYRIFERSRLLGELARLGYRLVDEWEVPESFVRVPFTALGRPVHRGFYLRRETTEA